MAYPKGKPRKPVNKGKPHSEETRKKISESCKKAGVGKWNKGRKVTWQTRKPVDKSKVMKNKKVKHSNKGHTGHKQTPEWCERHSEIMKDWWSVPENRARMLPNSKKGKKLSLKTRQKISEGNKGKSKTWLVGIPRSQEVKDKISKKNKGRKLSAEHRKKMSLASKGKPRPWRQGTKHTEETKKKISETKRKNAKVVEWWER